MGVRLGSARVYLPPGHRVYPKEDEPAGQAAIRRQEKPAGSRASCRGACQRGRRPPMVSRSDAGATRACGRRGPYPTVLGPAAPAALRRGRTADAWPPQWPGQLSRRLHRQGHRTASLRQPSPLRAYSQVVRLCHPRASTDGRQRCTAVIHGQRKCPLSCGVAHEPLTTP